MASSPTAVMQAKAKGNRSKDSFNPVTNLGAVKSLHREDKIVGRVGAIHSHDRLVVHGDDLHGDHN
jgi:hypothetical protein